MNEENEMDLQQEEETEEEIEQEELETEEQKQKKELSPAEKAIIQAKRENKELKAKLLEYEQKEKQKEIDSKKKQIADKYIERGYDEDEAKERADKDAKVEALEAELKKLKYERQAEKLEADYPEISDNLDRLIDICQKTGWSLEKVCAAEYGECSYDQKIKQEQEQQLKKTKKKVTTGGDTKIETVKLEPEDEKAYQFYAQKNPGITRKQYQEKILNHAQKIEHDRWEE